MSNLSIKLLSIRLEALTVFRALLNDPVIASLRAYMNLFDKKDSSDKEMASFYSEFVHTLFKSGYTCLAKYIRHIANNDENVYIIAKGKNEKTCTEMQESVINELETLQMIANLSVKDLTEHLSSMYFLPKFQEEKIDITADYKHRIANIGQYGYGIYAKYHMFYINSDNCIVPVRNPDTTTLDSLIDYKREQQIIVDNTVALLEGKPAANILLTGDAGTGKSSTVKAVVNELYERGLRVLEVRKDQLREIPAILDELNSNPLKFILFIDDLSFTKDDDNYSALKAILEGSVSAKAQNVVIYATSNRRHLVKESFSDRDGDDVHRNDTMQEIISLSERFGIQITFKRPDKTTYLGIVKHLAKDSGITLEESELELLAERYALERGGRSARAAKQFVSGLLAGVDN